MAKTKKEKVVKEVEKIIEPIVETKIVEVPKVEEKKEVEPEPVNEFEVFVKPKKVESDKVWVKDLTLLRKVEGRQYTLSGTLYLGELRK